MLLHTYYTQNYADIINPCPLFEPLYEFAHNALVEIDMKITNNSEII